MWVHEEHVITKAAAGDVWRLWSKPEEWNRWDEGIEWVKLAGPFERGTRGQLKPRGAGAVKFVLLEVRPEQGFSDRNFLPLAKMDFIHSYTPLPQGGGRITHRLEISGLLTPLFSRVIGRDIRKDLPGTLQRLSRLAEGGP
jgi:hypothetical protein